MGYKPYLYMEDDDWMDEYLNNPEFERNMYRMGYHPDRSDMRMDGMNHKQSRYGESYDRYSENRRHYHDSNDTESKRKMNDSMKEYTSDIIRTFQGLLEVEAGGTLMFKNSHGDDYRIPVPSSEEYAISLVK